MLEGKDVLILGIMKNEGPYILEWVAHHLSVGVDRFMIFSNDCDDGTDLILDRLAAHIPMRHQPNPKSLFPDRGNWHVMALRYAALFNDYKSAGWIYITDADEFLQIAPGDGTLEDFAAAAGRFDAVSFTSMPFSSNGVIALDNRPVMEQFTRASKPYAKLREEGTAVLNAVKTMLRNSVRFDMRRNHRPLHNGFSSAGLRWVDGSGNDMDAEFTDGKAKAANPLTTTDLAWFNHYAIKSAEAFMVKVDRGDGAGVDRLEKSLSYWRGYNQQGDEDHRASVLRPRAREILDGFMADPLLAELHQQAFDIHKTKAGRLRQLPQNQVFLSG